MNSTAASLRSSTRRVSDHANYVPRYHDGAHLDVILDVVPAVVRRRRRLLALATVERMGVMENPASWKNAELVIMDALHAHESAMAAGMVGGSREHTIAEALRRAGLLKDSGEEEIGWEKLRQHYVEKMNG